MMQAINLAEKLSLFSDVFAPKTGGSSIVRLRPKRCISC